MKTLAETIGEQIRARRKAMGLSQGMLADRLCLSHQTVVSYWECGRMCPNAAGLCDLADALKCSVDELLGRERGCLETD